MRLIDEVIFVLFCKTLVLLQNTLLYPDPVYIWIEFGYKRGEVRKSINEPASFKNDDL